MILTAALLTLSAISLSTQVEDFVSNNPEQIHLSYSGDVSSMLVTWLSLNPQGVGYVFFRRAGTSEYHKVDATKSDFVQEEGSLKRTSYVFRAKMEGLKSNTNYEYYVQTGPGISETFQFRTFDSGSDFRPTVALFGDLGTYYNISVPKLTKLANRGEIDLVIQAGDMAYDLNHDLGKMGDKYMNLIQPIASRVPYNFAAGNHEKYNNFSQFRGRFSSPGPNVFYNSFNVGPVHFVILTTEFYMFDEFGTGQIQAQYNWLKNDLEVANLPENREQQPWIIVMGHRPMYCTNVNDRDCRTNNPVRIGYKQAYFKLEELYLANRVDFVITGHKHDFERTYPMSNFTFEPHQNSNEFRNPRYPVHIISGSAGKIELADFMIPKPDWSAASLKKNVFTLLSVKEKNFLEFLTVASEGDEVLDKFVVIKDYSSSSSRVCVDILPRAVSILIPILLIGLDDF